MTTAKLIVQTGDPTPIEIDIVVNEGDKPTFIAITATDVKVNTPTKPKIVTES